MTEEMKEMVASAVAEAMKTKAKPTAYEMGYEILKTFGVSTVIVIVFLAVIWKVVPPWVTQNIELQQSLVHNLDIQTDSMNELVPQIKELQIQGKETALFRKQVLVEHAAMQIEVHEVKQATDTMQGEQTRQREEHKAIMDGQEATVSSLKNICDQLKQKPKP